MDRTEAYRRLNQYLGRYVTHSADLHWVGPVPVINQALVLFGSVLRKQDGVGDVDLASVYWAPGEVVWGRILDALNDRRWDCATGVGQAHRAVRRASIPQSRLCAVGLWDHWSPDEQIYREAEGWQTAGTIDEWLVLWTREQPDWQSRIEQLQAGQLAALPEETWPGPESHVSSTFTMFLLEECGLDPDDVLRRDPVIRILANWVALVSTIWQAWLLSPDSIRTLLPRPRLWQQWQDTAVYLEQELGVADPSMHLEGLADLALSIVEQERSRLEDD